MAAADPERARGLRLLYGGSVKADNIDALLAAKDVDGVLVERGRTGPQGLRPDHPGRPGRAALTGAPFPGRASPGTRATGGPRTGERGARRFPAPDPGRGGGGGPRPPCPPARDPGLSFPGRDPLPGYHCSARVPATAGTGSPVPRSSRTTSVTPDVLLTLAALSDIVKSVVFVVFVLVALLLTLVILVQEGKGGGIGAAFGGAAADAFGVKAGTVNRFTAYLAAGFLGLALLYAGLSERAAGCG